ncbi:hypothetical protein [Shewanella algae]|uniref:hypothetical protein n=1 Tax=Shewanella algae TaxID=38313 RepID=UPI0011826123|nr:hypothetical protein [Shewanella algae]
MPELRKVLQEVTMPALIITLVLSLVASLAIAKDITTVSWKAVAYKNSESQLSIATLGSVAIPQGYSSSPQEIQAYTFNLPTLESNDIFIKVRSVNERGDNGLNLYWNNIELKNNNSVILDNSANKITVLKNEKFKNSRFEHIELYFQAYWQN